MSEQDDKDLQDLEDFEDGEIVDPGQHEGESKKIKEGPSPDHPRFKQIYGKLKHTERELEDIKKAAASKEESFNLLKKHNEELGKSVEKAMKAIEDSVTRKEEKQIDDIDKKIEEIESDISTALDEDDFKTATKLQSQINKLYLKKIKVPNSDEIAKKVKDMLGDVAAPKEDNIDFKIWLKDNQWYEKDPIMRGAADAFGLELKSKGLKYSDLLNEVTKGVTKRFNLKKESPRKQFQTVEASDKTDIDLESNNDDSDEDVRVAKMFDMKVEDYRKQKKFAGGGR